MGRTHAAALVLVAVAALLLLCVPADRVSADAVDDLVTEYPDADYIIAQGANNTVMLVYYDAEGEAVSQSYSSGSDITVADWTDVDGSVTVVMDSGTVGTLTVLNVDRVASSENPVDVDFTMVSGTVYKLVGVAAGISASYSLPTSYASAYCPVDTLTMTVYGTVTEVCTTTALVEIRTLELTIGVGAVVDRLYPTGEDGYYGSVLLVVEGATVGYVSNQSSLVSVLDYQLRSGSVRYLCLGADSEGGSGTYLSNMWTFYVLEEATYSVSSSFEVGRAVLGSGLIDVPSILCNGEEPTEVFSRTIVIDAPGCSVSSDSCFLSGSTRAYRFTNYTIGSTVTVSNLRTVCYDSSYQTVQIYGTDGIWPGYRAGSVDSGASLYLGCDLTVAEDATFDVLDGGILVNSGTLAVSGVMNIGGTLINNGIVEVRDQGVVDGGMSGNGYLAACIYARTTEGRLDVMTEAYDAVVLRSSGDDLTFSTATVRLTGIGVVVAVACDSEITGSVFVIGVTAVEGESWTLYVSGFGDSASVQVTAPVTIPTGYEGKISDSEGNDMEIVSSTSSSITFVCSGTGVYTFRTVVDDADEIAHQQLVMNSAIAVAIVIVAVVAVYFLLRDD